LFFLLLLLLLLLLLQLLQRKLQLVLSLLALPFEGSLLHCH
jgi:hypothetical protein